MLKLRPVARTFKLTNLLCMGFALCLLALFASATLANPENQNSKPGTTPSSQVSGAGGTGGAEEVVAEADLGGQSILERAVRGGILTFGVLMLLATLSIVSWAIIVAKWFYLRHVEEGSDGFVKSFWASRSLNELNSRLQKFPYSPAREIFRNGYAELVRGSQLREQAISGDLVLTVITDNLTRALQKGKLLERRRLERFLPFLAICASTSPFIGLFGTVWGIMNSFEGIARTGSASLAAVAPGISEALIATAFGLAAAIPAVVGYNIFNSKIRHHMLNLDGFSSDFLNIVARHVVGERARGQNIGGGAAHVDATASIIDTAGVIPQSTN